MSLIKDTWRQLVRNRLWPIALGLVAAAVAVPVLLAKSPAPAPTPAPVATNSAAAKADRLALEPAVVKADDSQPTRRRHVLGSRKDPFAPAPQPKVKVKKVHTATSATPGVAGTGGSTSTGTSGLPGSAPVTTAPVGIGPVTGPTPAPAPKAKPKQYPGDSLTVRFGNTDASPKSLLETGKALPEAADDATEPVLVYLHLDKTGKRAIFLLDASVRADGDGTCVADATSGCEELRMRAGDTEFLDVTDETGTVVAQYQLDVLAIHPSKQTKAAAARASRHAAKDAKAVTAALATAAGAASAHHGGELGAGVGALLGSL